MGHVGERTRRLQPALKPLAGPVFGDFECLARDKLHFSVPNQQYTSAVMVNIMSTPNYLSAGYHS